MGGIFAMQGKKVGVGKLLADRAAPPSRENPDKKIPSPLKIVSMY